MRRKPRSGSGYKKVRDFMDQDYESKLSEDEKKWLHEFNQVYYVDNVDYTRDSEYLQTPAEESLDEIGEHFTEVEHRRWLGRRNTKRNRDIYTQGIRWIYNDYDEELASNSPEDAIINLIDLDKIHLRYETYIRLRRIGVVKDENE